MDMQLNREEIFTYHPAVFEGSYQEVTAAAPVNEPERQYYFMQYARTLLKADFEEQMAKGAAAARYGEEKAKEMLSQGIYGTFKINTFGCQMNR